MRVLCILAILNVVLSGRAAECEINISASPKLPVENLVKNSDFSAGGAQPDDWKFAERSAYFHASREPWRCEFGRKEKGGRSGAFLTMDVLTASLLSELFIRQEVSVQPDTLYRIGVYARIRSGQAYLHILNQDKYAYRAKNEFKTSWRGSPLTGSFVPAERLRGPKPDEWVLISTEIRTKKDETLLYVDVGSYYERASVDFDDVYCEAAHTALSVDVACQNLKQVVVSDDAGVTHWDSGGLQADTDRIKKTLSGLPSEKKYKVTVINSENKSFSQWYPKQP